MTTSSFLDSTGPRAYIANPSSFVLCCPLAFSFARVACVYTRGPSRRTIFSREVHFCWLVPFLGARHAFSPENGVAATSPQWTAAVLSRLRAYVLWHSLMGSSCPVVSLFFFLSPVCGRASGISKHQQSDPATALPDFDWRTRWWWSSKE